MLRPGLQDHHLFESVNVGTHRGHPIGIEAFFYVTPLVTTDLWDREWDEAIGRWRSRSKDFGRFHFSLPRSGIDRLTCKSCAIRMHRPIAGVNRPESSSQSR